MEEVGGCMGDWSLRSVHGGLSRVCGEDVGAEIVKVPEIDTFKHGGRFL